MPVNLDVTIRNEALAAIIDKVQAKLVDARPLWASVGELLMSSIQFNFEEGGRPQEWAALSGVTIADRIKRRKWPGQILVRSGRLKHSINYRAEADRVTVGANMIYAALQQFGARKGQFGTRQVTVAAHTRSIGTGQHKWGKRGSAGRSGATVSHEVMRSIQVRAHLRKMSIPWGDIPARPFLVVQDEDYVGIGDLFREYWRAS